LLFSLLALTNPPGGKEASDETIDKHD
jgi:hypothetical protein